MKLPTNEETPPTLKKYLAPNKEVPKEDTGDPAHNSEGVWYAFLEGNPHMADRMFNELPRTKQESRALIGQLFDTKEYESRSLPLRKYDEPPVPGDETLAEKVKRIL